MAQTLDPVATQGADDDFYANHPEMVQNGRRVPIGAPGFDSPVLKQEWAKDYQRQKARQNPPTSIHGRIVKQAVGDPVTPCSLPGCGVTAMVLSCGHAVKPVPGNRHARSPDNKLQIVPSDNATEISRSITFGKFIKFSVQGTKDDGSDLLTVGLEPERGVWGNDCFPQIRIESPGQPTADFNSDGCTQTIPSPTLSHNPGIWLDDFPPVVYNISGGGRPLDEEAPIEMQVEAFPSDAVTKAVLSLDLLSEIVTELNKVIDDWGGKMWGQCAGIILEFKSPAGGLELACGWKEHTDWRAYYGWEVRAGLVPLAGISFGFKVDFVAMAAAAVSIPPFLTKYAAQLVASIAVSQKIDVTGRAARTGPENFEYGVRGVVTGSLTLQVEAIAGNKKLTQAKIVAGGVIGVTGSANVEYREGPGGGLVLAPKIGFDGITVTVKLSLAIADKTVVTDQTLGTWHPLDATTLWEPSGGYVLIHNDTP